MWFYLRDEVSNNIYISLTHWELFDLTRLIERKIQEVYVVEWDLIECTSCASLSTTDKSLDCAYILCVDITFLLAFQEVLNLFVFKLDNLILLVTEYLVKAIDEVHEAYNFLISNGNVA